MRRVLPVTIAVLLPAAYPSLAGPTTRPKTRPIVYEKLGFTLDVPLTSVGKDLPVEGAVELCEVFKYGDLIFAVRVSKSPSGTVAATAIEQAIQAQTPPRSQGDTKRWEPDLPGGEIVKGVTGSLSPDDSSSEAGYARQALGGRPAWRTLGMLESEGETSRIVTLSVAGPKNRSAEIEEMAEFFASGFSRGKAGKPPPKPDEPVKPVTLKEGDIELVGNVESLNPEDKSLTMVVGQIRMAHTGYIELDPPRGKLVYYKKPLPPGIDVSSKISVVGYNTGVGKPITVDAVEPGE